MVIDNFYNSIDKNNFYLGRISQVYRGNSVIQVENLSLLSHRKIKNESLIANTINYFVVIDSTQGLFLGEVFQSKILNTVNMHDSINEGKPESVYPEICVDIIGLMKYGDSIFRLPEFLTVGITDKTYIANEVIIQKYMQSIEIRKNDDDSLPPFATFLNLRDQTVALKASTLFDRHLMAVGTTNSGKSTSALSILDKLIKSQKKLLIIDPTGEYDESFNNQEVKKLNLGLDTILSVGEISMQQWSILFETNGNTQSAVLSEAIRSLRYQNKIGDNTIYKKDGENIQCVQQNLSTIMAQDKAFDISLLPEQIVAESVVESSNRATQGQYVYDTFRANTNSYLVQKVNYQLANTSFLDFFSGVPGALNLLTEIDAFLTTPTSSLYINTSQIGTGDGIGGMIVDLISNYVINQKDNLPFVMFIDEVHRYTRSPYVETEYHSGLTMVAREGRKKGIFLFLTTQNPQDVSPVLLGQVGTLIIHRLTHNDELKTIQNHLDEHAIKQVKKLNQGESILTSINLLQNLYIHVNKCSRKHKNETPRL
ncbi:ATP-binding protein [Clostridium sp. UBA7503]|uniref:ATP-binding protein n=1 Tax=Clostridium sp. UBA7503 TaxID=1946377 RepID=UPI003216CBFB